MSGAGSVRLDRLLANLGYGSRREVQQLMKLGVVTLDGAPVSEADLRLTLDRTLSDRLAVEGRRLDPAPGVALMLHKPVGVTCSHKEEGRLVYDLLPARWRRREPQISTVGRLDKETSGLLLLTDDGALLHKIISPRRHVAKRYRATLARPLRGDETALFASGELLLEGEDKPLAPAVLEPEGEREARLTVTEGRYHQVRRMFAAAGNHVETLHRDRIGALDLPPDLEPGRYRVMSEGDVAQVLGGA